MGIQNFLNVDNKKCQISQTNTNLKPFHPCVLRYGVELNKKQSFISCLADIYIEYHKGSVPTIKEMKNIIIKSLTLDNFIKYNNGNLIQLFNTDSDESIKDYTKTKIYKNIDIENERQVKFLKKTISAYKNFIDYLNNDNIVIDYTYLWDIISLPNKNLFPEGLNLVILELVQNDITDNVEIICPTNSYTSELFDINKYTLLLIKSKEFYEPIYILEDIQTKFKLTKLFNLKKLDLENLKDILNIIKVTINNSCLALPSQPTIYKFKQNLEAYKIYNLLVGKKYEILYQIINFNGKIIGLVVKKGDLSGFVPTYPSSQLDSEIPLKFMDDDNIWTNYTNTIKLLTQINIENNEKISCLPQLKVIEDGLIVGIITNANQFIALAEPEQDTYGDDLESINNKNYINTDIIIETSNEVDNKRVRIIKNIKLETDFYNVFRNQIRLSLGEYQNKAIRIDIEKILSNPLLLYLDKLKILIGKIQEIGKNIKFISFSKKILNNINEITNCIDIASCENKNFCLLTEDSQCQLLVPKINLINGEDNEKIYYGKIADELMRYNRIKAFIFEPASYLSFSKINYNLNKDEIILLQSLITQEYFENINAVSDNKYIKNNTYDTAIPRISQYYNTDIEIDDVKSSEVLEDNLSEKAESNSLASLNKSIECQINKKNLLGKWKSSFPSNTLEIFYTCDEPICTYELFLLILKDDNQTYKDWTKEDLKKELVNIYKIYESYFPLIFKILENQGKGTLIKKIKYREINFDEVLLSEHYYLTNFDLCLMANYYKLPLILISSTTLKENNKSLLVVYSTNASDFYFIKTPGVRATGYPVQKLIYTKNGAKINILELNIEFQKEIKENIDNDFILKYIKRFVNKKMKKLVVDESKGGNKNIKIGSIKIQL